MQRARRVLDAAIVAAVAGGHPPTEVARAAGLSAARVKQIAPRPKGGQPRGQAGKEGAEAVRVADPDTVPALPATLALSGYASTRNRQPYGRRTVCVPAAPVPELLHQAAMPEVPAGEHVRLILTGPAPMDTSRGATMPEAVRAWALTDLPEGWAAESHYLADPAAPVLRFRHDHGRRVTIVRGAAWWGESDAPPAVCQSAWDGLERSLAAVPAFAGAGLADTPATTGRALWRRTIPEGKAYPVLGDELRELLAATAGQGRIELRPAPAVPWAGGVRDFTYLDGRFMYAALTWGMPIGEPRRWTGAEVDQLDAGAMMRTLRGRGRWRVTVTVPAGWRHVGLLMAPEAAGGAWRYPSEPGETFTTWADGCEVWLAGVHGWEPVIHEGLTWAEGKPLNLWTDELVGVWSRANAAHTPAGDLGANAVRSILLKAIGAFATRQHPTTHAAPVDSDPEVPPGTPVRVVGDQLVWETPGGLNAWSAETAHPEWAATIWARARSRLLDAPGVRGERTGALHLDPSRVIAFRTDALYVVGDPRWGDDGKPGRFRSKGTRPGAFGWPTSAAELFLLRDDAENGATA